MRFNEILLESISTKLPALETVYEARWDRAPIKHYSSKEQDKIHKTEELPYDWKNQQSIWKYTGSAGPKWNNFLHRHYRGLSRGADLKKYSKNISQVDRELARNVFKRDYTLYTGLRESPALAYKLYKQPTDQPLTVHLPAYTSTTTEWAIAFQFARDQGSWDPSDISGHKVLDARGKKIKKMSPNNGRNVPKKPEIDILRIFVPAGTTGGSVSQLSMNGEAEILLPRGLDIIISPRPHIVDHYGYRILVWNARVVGHNPQPVEVVQNT
jgi:hypothetical protein